MGIGRDLGIWGCWPIMRVIMPEPAARSRRASPSIVPYARHLGSLSRLGWSWRSWPVRRGTRPSRESATRRSWRSGGRSVIARASPPPWPNWAPWPSSGDYAQAQALFQEARTRRQQLGDTAGVAATLVHLGGLASAQGDYGRAVLFGRRSGPVTHRERSDCRGAMPGGAGLSRAGWRPSCVCSAAFWGRCRPAPGNLCPLCLGRSAAREWQIASVRAALGEQAFAAAWAEGRGMSFEAAVALALDGR